jgi:glyoxylase-like metal-dependent hydrolase (beta-lactamase superfamily II)
VTVPPDITVLVRGWLHGNSVLVSGEHRALIDTGYHTGTDALLDFVGDPIDDVVLTHVHSDHAGGVAALAPARVFAHADAAALTDPWNPVGLWLDGTGQELPQFGVTDIIAPGSPLLMGDREWLPIDTPGHATGGLCFLSDGVLVTGDALWEDGFGMLNPWVDGPGVFDRAQLALDNLAGVDAALVIPGHGPPFSDFAGALERANGRLHHLRAHPDRLHAQMIRNGLGFYRLMHPDATDQELAAKEAQLRAVHSV